MDSVQNSLFVDDDTKSVISDLKFCKILNWLDFKITLILYITAKIQMQRTNAL